MFHGALCRNFFLLRNKQGQQFLSQNKLFHGFLYSMHLKDFNPFVNHQKYIRRKHMQLRCTKINWTEANFLLFFCFLQPAFGRGSLENFGKVPERCDVHVAWRGWNNNKLFVLANLLSCSCYEFRFKIICFNSMKNQWKKQFVQWIKINLVL